jgi:ATP-dependent DNA helicase RecG
MGTGINRIKNAMDKANLLAPEFKFFEYSFYTTLFDKTYMVAEEKTVEKTVEKIILAMKNNPKITQKELETITGLKRRGIEWNIKKIKEKRIIKRIGHAKGGYWEVIEK